MSTSQIATIISAIIVSAIIVVTTVNNSRSISVDNKTNTKIKLSDIINEL